MFAKFCSWNCFFFLFWFQRAERDLTLGSDFVSRLLFRAPLAAWWSPEDSFLSSTMTTVGQWKLNPLKYKTLLGLIV